MSKISRELVAAMKFYVPHSLVKHQFRLLARRRNPFPRSADEIMQELPAWLVGSHLPVEYSNFSMNCAIDRKVRTLTEGSGKAFPSNPDDKSRYLNLCTLHEGESLGFAFPGWRQSKFAREINPDCLSEEAQKLYQYCLKNDLRPGFDKIFRDNGKKACTLMIRWQKEHFDKLLGLPEHPLFNHCFQAQAPLPSYADGEFNLEQLQAWQADTEALREQVKAEVEAQFEIDLDEESDRSCASAVESARAKVAEAAKSGSKEVLIFVGSEGVAALNCFCPQISKETLDSTPQSELHRIFRHPLCHDGVIARGLCRWANQTGLHIRLNFMSAGRSPGQRVLYLYVSWKESSPQ